MVSLAAAALTVLLHFVNGEKAVAGQKWVAPSALRACFTSFKVDPEIKANIVDVVNKTLAFHTSVNYELLAPEPFTADVHENLLADLARIRKQEYPSDFDLHVDMSRTLKRLNDGHCVYTNACYDSAFLTFLPTPVVLLTDPNGAQNVHIAPEAFAVASAEFSDEIDVWQDALPGALKGELSSLSGAKVLLINGADPFDAVDANAQITGSFQGFGTRQNSFFSSYNRADAGWMYIMGNFAQMSLPLADSATLTIQRVNNTKVETVTLPYRSRLNNAVSFTNSTTYRQNNCVAVPGTNGVDLNAPDTSDFVKRSGGRLGPVSVFRQMAPISPEDALKHLLNVMLDTAPPQDIALPPGLAPTNPVNGSTGVSEFHLLNDGKTGVLALGSFSEASFNQFEQTLIAGLTNLKTLGATQLIVDVSNNGGGFICIAHWLHRILAGPKNTTIPQAGLDTMARDGQLAMLITKAIVTNTSIDPNGELIYNPISFGFHNGTPFAPTFDWLEPPVDKIINGRHDAFTMRMADTCQPFALTPPAAPLFDPKKTAIVSNGSLADIITQVTMAKEEGAKMVVLGGKDGVQQEYCGTVGGQSTDFSTIDTSVKTTHLKNNSLAPPDFQTNSVQGITWRLGFGIQDPTQPEEWQNHPADVNLHLTPDIVNNPIAIWEQVAKTVL